MNWLNIVGTVYGRETDPHALYSYSWTELNGLVDLSPTSPALGSKPNSPNLVLLPYSLREGPAYAFRLDVYALAGRGRAAGERVGSATVELALTNAAPRGGVCAASPTTGHTHTHTLTHTACVLGFFLRWLPHVVSFVVVVVRYYGAHSLSIRMRGLGRRRPAAHLLLPLLLPQLLLPLRPLSLLLL